MSLRTLNGTVLTSILLLLSALSPTAGFGQWERQVLPPAYALDYYLDISFLPSDTRFGWACGREGSIVRTTDGGQTWRGTTAPIQFLESIQFLDRFTGYCSGPNGIVRSDDGGATWYDVTPDEFSPFQNGWGLYFLDRNNGVFLAGGCGDQAQVFFRTSDGGLSWSRNIHFEPESGLSDAILYPDGTGFAVSSGLLWETFDHGRSWFVRSRTPQPYWTEELAIFDGRFVLPTAGEDCSGSSGGVGSIMFGSSINGPWNVFQTGAAMFGTAFVDAQRAWGVGLAGSVFYTDDAGRSWTLRNCGIGDNDIDDVTVIDDTTVWLAGQGIYRSRFSMPSRMVTIGGPDTVVVCPGEPYELVASDSLTAYRWSSGSTNRRIVVTTDGTYVIRAMDPATCIESADTVVVRSRPVLAPVIENGMGGGEYCDGTTVVVRVTNGPFKELLWSDGSTGDSIVIRQAGAYTVQMTDSNGCVSQSQAFIARYRPLPDARITVTGPLTFCLDDSVTLAGPSGLAVYRWSTGETSPTITVRESGRYTLSVQDDLGCGDDSDTIDVVVLQIRNKISLAGVADPFRVDDHDVGDRRCTDLLIRNRSATEDLVLGRPWLQTNVTFSVPLGQLPVVIAPGETGALTICAAATDTGFVTDTLVLSDTCSPVVIGLSSRGLAIELQGMAQCALPVGATIYRAGASHQLAAPVPNPVSQRAAIQILATGNQPLPDVDLIDATHRIVARGYRQSSVSDGERILHTMAVDVDALAPGAYMLLVHNSADLHRALPLTVVR